jgi:hypothetical protein
MTIPAMGSVARVPLAATVAVAAIAVVAGCSGSPGQRAAPPSRPTAAGAGSLASPVVGQHPLRLAAHSCGSTALRNGRPPGWVSRSSPNPPTNLPFAVSAQHNVVGFLFGYPLAGYRRSDPTNKVLWIVRTPRHGHPLVLTARPLGTSHPIVRERLSADSGPGEIYPSIVNLPSPGCWHVTLRWHHASASLNLQYVAKT